MEPDSFAEVSSQAKLQVLGRGPTSMGVERTTDSNLALSYYDKGLYKEHV